MGHYANKCPKKLVRSAAQSVRFKPTHQQRPFIRSGVTDIKSKDIATPNSILDKGSQHMVIDVKINRNPGRALVDPQTTGASLISCTYAATYDLPTIPLEESITVDLALQGSRGKSTHYDIAKLDIGGSTETVTFCVAALADWDMNPCSDNSKQNSILQNAI